MGGPFFVQNRKHPCSKCNPVSANMGLVLHCSMPMYGSQETQQSPKGHPMTLMTNLQNRIAKRISYVRTRNEIANLPTELAVNDLGIFPSDARKIAARVVYG